MITRLSPEQERLFVGVDRGHQMGAIKRRCLVSCISSSQQQDVATSPIFLALRVCGGDAVRISVRAKAKEEATAICS